MNKSVYFLFLYIFFIVEGIIFKKFLLNFYIKKKLAFPYLPCNDIEYIYTYYNINYQQQIIYNSIQNEYLMIYIQQV